LTDLGGSSVIANVEEVTMNVGIISLVKRLKENNEFNVTVGRGIYDEILLRIERYIVEDHQKRITISYPRGWWQALKKDYLTGIANYFPVKMVHKVIDAKIYYPNIAIPKEKAYVKFKRYVCNSSE
jgi:hypothetical protein